jgi:hypothetical protein
MYAPAHLPRSLASSELPKQSPHTTHTHVSGVFYFTLQHPQRDAVLWHPLQLSSLLNLPAEAASITGWRWQCAYDAGENALLHACAALSALHLCDSGCPQAAATSRAWNTYIRITMKRKAHARNSGEVAEKQQRGSHRQPVSKHTLLSCLQVPPLPCSRSSRKFQRLIWS